MSDWLKLFVTALFNILGSAASASFLVWNLVQDNAKRIEILEVKMLSVKELQNDHVRWHEAQYNEINKKLTEIQVDIGRIQGMKNGR